MNENHDLLREMGVSSPELDRLVSAAREAGALGAKLSGAGRGGNMIALAAGRADDIAQALREAGAIGIIVTNICELEHRHAEGYAKYPAEPGEFDFWQDEQDWGDA